ncbi:TIGR03619 family F420-dependent LLM class oxidoreductase [Rhodococcus sp. 1168]|uniref:TIGR03619 family F420-dependent LLM class oxidoreductase n=1 Tax=Rhodococcus sp. 1168 TaxID=2018041 RepID=UPI000A0EAEFB|nr:TIGR03619 family F420-dependent LLM class oxidoreductase [Rhodococcus sp. 1168]ORI26139.1 LLM class F420-dependent oxidoreductase [Rhodococcus sp. 1168]
MHIGITSPIVVQHPSSAADWEASAGIAELVRIARQADQLGFHHLTCSEHIAVPVDVAAERGATYWDPLATLGFLAAYTDRIKLATQVLVLGYHHPLAIAKRYGTLDMVSGGRLILGLGVGSLREEFDLLGAEFEGRGALADDALAALRASLSQSNPEYHGTHYDFANLVVKPHAVQTRVPLWIGGRTPRSLRRARTQGDGWVPFGLALGDLERILAKGEQRADFEVVLSAGAPVDPLGNRAAVADSLERRRQAGATIVSAAIHATSVEHYCDQLSTLRDIGDELGVDFHSNQIGATP